MKKIIMLVCLLVLGISNVLAKTDDTIDQYLRSDFYKNDVSLYKELKNYFIDIVEKKDNSKINWKEFKSNLKTNAIMLKETYPTNWDSQYDNFVAKQFNEPYWIYRKYKLGKYILENTNFVTNPDKNVKIIDSLITKFLLKLTKISDSQRKSKIEKICVKLEKILPTIKDKKTQDYVKYLEYELLTQHTPYVKILKNGYYAYFLDKDFDKDGKYNGCWEKGLINQDTKCMIVNNLGRRLLFIYTPYKYVKFFNPSWYKNGNYSDKLDYEISFSIFNQSGKKYPEIHGYIDNLKLGGVDKFFLSLRGDWNFQEIHEIFNKDIAILLRGKVGFSDVLNKELCFLIGNDDDCTEDKNSKKVLWGSNRFIDIWGIWPFKKKYHSKYENTTSYIENYLPWPIK